MMSSGSHLPRRSKLKTYGKNSKSSFKKSNSVALNESLYIDGHEESSPSIHARSRRLSNVYDFPSSDDVEQNHLKQTSTFELNSENVQTQLDIRECSKERMGTLSETLYPRSGSFELSRTPKDYMRTQNLRNEDYSRNEIYTNKDAGSIQSPRKRKRGAKSLKRSTLIEDKQIVPIVNAFDNSDLSNLKSRGIVKVSVSLANAENLFRTISADESHKSPGYLSLESPEEGDNIRMFSHDLGAQKKNSFLKNSGETKTSRQESFWDKLLDVNEDGTPKISDFDAPVSLVAGVSQSTAVSRKYTGLAQNHLQRSERKRIIDTLKHDSSESEASSSLSETASGPASISVSPRKEDRNAIIQTKDYQKLSFEGNNARTSLPTSSRISENFDSNSAPGFPTITPRITYAKSRSHLYELSSQNNFSDFSHEDERYFNPHELKPYSNQKGQIPGGLQEREQNDDNIDDSNKAIKSVHELRAAGVNRRIVDEINGFLDDITDLSDSSRSIRRMAIIDLAMKLTKKEYRENVKENLISQKFLEGMTKGSKVDVIFASVASLALIILLENSSQIFLECIQISGFLKHLVTLLDFNTDILTVAKNRQFKMSKITLGSLFELKAAAKDTNSFTMNAEFAFSPQNIALLLLSIVIPRIRELGNTEEILSPEMTAKLVAILNENILKIDWSSELSTSTFEATAIILSILELGSSGGAIQPHWHSREIENLRQLSYLFIDQNRMETRHIERLLLRLFINLTNDNSRICRLFSTLEFISNLCSSIVHKFEEVRSQPALYPDIMDNLVLSLGAIINLIESNGEVRSFFIPEQNEMIELLCDAFLIGQDDNKQATSFQESQLNVAYGYLAMLLGHLCGSEIIRDYLRTKLADDGLDILIRASNEFVLYQREADKNNYVRYEGYQERSDDPDRLQAVIKKLRDYGGSRLPNQSTNSER